MNAQLAELTAAYRSGAELGGARDGLNRWPASSPPRRSEAPGTGRGDASPLRLLLVLLVLGGLVAAAVVGARSLAGGTDPGPLTDPAPSASPAPARTGGSSPTAGRDFPPPGAGSSPGRLLPAVAPPRGEGGYAFVDVRADGSPVTYDPCRPLTYVVRAAGAPSGGDRLIRDAAAQLSAATGLSVVDGGSTDEAPADRRPAYQPERYGQRWAPVLISWSDPGESPQLAGATAGVGGSQSVTHTEGGTVSTAFVTGSVVLDAPQLREIGAREGPDAVRAVIAHELGHVAGLDHVDDDEQLMYPEGSIDVDEYQEGDRRGLALLGNGPCTPAL